MDSHFPRHAMSKKIFGDLGKLSLLMPNGEIEGTIDTMWYLLYGVFLLV